MRFKFLNRMFKKFSFTDIYKIYTSFLKKFLIQVYRNVMHFLKTILND